MKYAIGIYPNIRLYLETQNEETAENQCREGETYWEVDEIPQVIIPDDWPIDPNDPG